MTGKRVGRQPGLKLTSAELDRALKFVELHGASDFFPQPFEYRAIRYSWVKIRPVLQNVDLLSYEPLPAIEMMAPKFDRTVRRVHLLDPLDLILFVGLVLRFAPHLESKRATYQENRVYSNLYASTRRTAPKRVPSISTNAAGYRQTVNLRSMTAGAIATTDIADFFTRIYLHRLENAVAAIGADDHLSRALLRLIEGWSHGTSYGIPIGPIASNLLGETILIEVDEYLLSMGVDFVRLADDYVIFGRDEGSCSAALQELGARLLVAEGLTLNASKTRVWSPDEFRKLRVLSKGPEDDLKRKIIDHIFHGDPYGRAEYDALSTEQRTAVDSVDADSWLNTALAEEPADTGAVRFLLHFLSAFQRPDLVAPILDNLSRLIPVSEAVGKFLISLTQLSPDQQQEIGGKLLGYIGAADAFVPDFQTMWLLEPFVRSSDWNNLVELRRFARSHRNPLVRRQAVLGLGTIGDRSALLDAKLSVEEATPWEVRAIIYACRALPSDERKAFYRIAVGGGDWNRGNLLVKAVKELAEAIA